MRITRGRVLLMLLSLTMAAHAVPVRIGEQSTRNRRGESASVMAKRQYRPQLGCRPHIRLWFPPVPHQHSMLPLKSGTAAKSRRLNRSESRMAARN